MKNLFFAAFFLVIGSTLSGCVSAPTYGTDKTATAQLMDDLSGMASLKTQKGADIEYKQRPDLVTPPANSALPEPQLSVTKNENIWPESPEETRKRLVAEADANKDNPAYVSPLANSNVLAANKTKKQQREEYLAARRLQKGQYKERKFLSDPPAGYKQPASTAPIGELGETEATKERMLKAGRKSTGKRRWWQVWKKR